MLGDHALCQSNYLLNRLIEIEAVVPRGHFLDLISDPVDNASGSIALETVGTSMTTVLTKSFPQEKPPVTKAVQGTPCPNRLDSSAP